jgi:hypothetical protein
MSKVEIKEPKNSKSKVSKKLQDKWFQEVEYVNGVEMDYEHPGVVCWRRGWITYIAGLPRITPR